MNWFHKFVFVALCAAVGVLSAKVICYRQEIGIFAANQRIVLAQIAAQQKRFAEMIQKSLPWQRTPAGGFEYLESKMHELEDTTKQ